MLAFNISNDYRYLNLAIKLSEVVPPPKKVSYSYLREMKIYRELQQINKLKIEEAICKI